MIVTHNMQQAARVADMTAFFSLSEVVDGQRSGVLVEYDRTRQDLHDARRQANGGLRHGAVRLMPMRIPLQEDLNTLQATLMEEGDLCARAIRGAMQALRDRDPELG